MNEIPDEFNIVEPGVLEVDIGDKKNSQATSVQVIINELAKLSPVEYEAIRNGKAKELSFRATVLDKVVSEARKQITEQDDVVTTDEPYPDKVDANQLLIDIEKIITRHMILPAGASAVIALWIAGTYVFDNFRIFPKLAIISPEKRCGKSTLLDILSGLCCKSLFASNITPAAIFRSIDAWKPTLIIDEADTFLANRNDDLIGVINSGHTKSTAFVVRVVGDEHTPKRFSTWAPMAFASIKGIAGTIMDRGIIIRLKRRTLDEKVKRLSIDFKQENTITRQKLTRLAEDLGDTLRRNPIEPPTIPNDRAIDNWLPLFTIAHAIGGSWPEKIETAYFSINSMEEEETASIMLLQDIKKVFEQTDKIHSEELVNQLVTMEERPWCEWKHGKPMTQNSLSKFLKEFGIKSKQVWSGCKNKRGFEKSQFDDVFNRYIPNTQFQSGTMEQSSNDAGSSHFQSGTKGQDVPLQKPRKATAGAGCSTVPLPKGGKPNDESEFQPDEYWGEPDDYLDSGELF